MSLQGSASDSDQKSNAYSGVSPIYKEKLSEDAYNESQKYGAAAQQFFDSPFGYYNGQHVNSLVPQENGLPTVASQWMKSMMSQAISKASAGGSFRGQNTPENTNAVVGSAMQNMAPTILPMVLDNQKYMTGLADQLAATKLGYLQSSLAAKQGLLGSSSNYTGSSNSFGFGVGSGGGGGGKY